MFALFSSLLFIGNVAFAQPELSYRDLYKTMVDHGYDNIFQKTYVYESDGQIRGDSSAILYTTLKYTDRYQRHYEIQKYSTQRLDYFSKHLNIWRQPDTICGESDPWPCGGGYQMDSARRWIIYTSRYTMHSDSAQHLDSSITLYDKNERPVSTASYSIQADNQGRNFKQKFWLDSIQYDDRGQRYREVFEHYDVSDGILTYRTEYLNTFNEEGLLQTTVCSEYSLKHRDTTIGKTYYTYQRCPGKKKKRKWRPYNDG